MPRNSLFAVLALAGTVLSFAATATIPVHGLTAPISGALA
jgi:hypothetical protein